MSETTLQAIELLEEAAAAIRSKAEAQAGELEKTAASLRGKFDHPASRKPAPSLAAAASATPTLFRGMTQAVALEVYMRLHPGERLPLSQIVKDLATGGCYLGEHKDRRERNLMAAARYNPRVYGLDQEKRLIWLAETAYTNPPNRYENGAPRKKAPARIR